MNSKTFKAACIQLEVGKDTKANLAHTIEWIKKAIAGGGQMIVLPELCNHPGPFPNRESAWAIAETPGGEWDNAMATLAKTHKVFIAYNILTRDGEPFTRITTYLVDPQGTIIAEYAKQFLFATQADWARPGKLPLNPVSTNLGRIGLYICMDGLIPEPTRVLQIKGAQVLLNALNSAGPDEADLHVPARAAEIRAWVLSANKVGTLSATHASVYAGGSAIIAPNGKVVARASDDKEEIIYGTIQADIADDKSIGNGDDLLLDRKPECYMELLEPTEIFPSYKCEVAPERWTTLSVVQVNAKNYDDVEVITRVEKHLTKLNDLKAKVAVLPEGFLFSPGEIASNPDKAAETSKRALGNLKDSSRKYQVLISANLVEKTETNEYYNTVYLIEPSGNIWKYRQVHVANADRSWAKSGKDFPVFETTIGTVGLMLGYDGLFPEAARILSLKGASVILYPCNWRLDVEPELLVIERAAENHISVVASNRTDSPIQTGSKIITGERYPTTKHWKMRFPESETLHYGVESSHALSVDLGAMVQKLVAYKTDLIADRSVDQYSALIEQG